MIFLTGYDFWNNIIQRRHWALAHSVDVLTCHNTITWTIKSICYHQVQTFHVASMLFYVFLKRTMIIIHIFLKINYQKTAICTQSKRLQKTSTTCWKKITSEMNVMMIIKWNSGQDWNKRSPKLFSYSTKYWYHTYVRPDNTQTDIQEEKE